MSPDGSIRVEHLWKRFHADRRQRSLRHQFTQFGRGRRPESERWRWVLRDIELGLEPGEAVGLIGANGSGKSTLLKILTGVMYPYAGRLDVNGRVGALLEVRAGLHAELTGRENVYLYGGLLGLARSDVAARFDEILEFSALEDAIDRQVKFYSSGMQMRLGFSVAAFLEPDILLVDEALAVGDAFFQQRCLDRMRDLLQMGTTLVLVSHDLAAVESVCERGVWLRDGVIEYDGDTRTTLGNYRTWFDDAYHDWIDEVGAEESVYHVGAISVLDAQVHGPGGGDPVSQQALTVDLTLDSPEAIEGRLCIGVTEGTASPVFVSSRVVGLEAGTTTVTCELPNLPLASGRYHLWVEFDGPRQDDLRLSWQPTRSFTVEGRALERAPIGVMRVASVQLDATWQVGAAGSTTPTGAGSSGPGPVPASRPDPATDAP